ncbi:hypothetical protein HNP31_000954 [Acinetobacter johnsonii]|nr:hypothetical protein [Acinetobacter johnsonii]
MIPKRCLNYKNILYMVLHHLPFYSKIVLYQNNLKGHRPLNKNHHKMYISSKLIGFNLS